MIETRPRVRRPFLLAACVAAGCLLSGGSVASAQEPPVRQVLDEDGIPQVRFNFKQQSWDQVLDYFSRASGLPVVRSVEVPTGTVDYFHPSPYPLPERPAPFGCTSSP